jgi:pantetheine-phosphate adenylyltransferase
MTLTNHRLDPEIETVFLMADGEYSHISSSLIKQVGKGGGAAALSRFVPEELVEPIIAKLLNHDHAYPEPSRW